jgi:hypothetical protein
MKFKTDAQRRAVFADISTRFQYKPGEGIMPLSKISVPTWGDEGDVTPEALHEWQSALPSGIVFDPIIIAPMQTDPSRYGIYEGRHRFLSEEEVGSENIPYKIRPQK